MKNKDLNLKSKNEAELGKIVEEKREAVRAFAFAASGSKKKNVRESRTNRKDLARVLTELASRAKNNQ